MTSLKLHEPDRAESLVEGPGWIGIMSQWILWRVLHLSELLGPEGTAHWLWHRGETAPKGLKAIAGIGYKSSSDHARVLCKRWGLPYIALEDGFLRSSSLGVEGDTPLSMVVDPIGIHYLAERPSLLENLLQQPEQITAAELETTRELIALMRHSGIGKYNNAPDLAEDDPLGRERPLVLVVDQTYGDFAISGGGLHESDFIRMLDAALAENPGSDVRVRIHPDCVAGYKRSCLLEAAKQRGVTLEARQLSWSSLARRAQRVYVGTSQAGLEALILGVPVTCFGAPFYAGWGLTDDRLPVPRRRARPTLEQLVATAYIRYCRYVDPLTGGNTDVLTVAKQLARQKRQDTEFAGAVTVVGAPHRLQPTLRRFLGSRWGKLMFAEDRTGLVEEVAARQGKLLAWTAKAPDDLARRAAARGVRFARLAEGVLPTPTAAKDSRLASLRVDWDGSLSDPSGTAALESCLLEASFEPELLAEARRLRERIVGRSAPIIASAAKLPSGSRCVLVLGEAKVGDIAVTDAVEADLALLRSVRQLAPDARVLYMPHPSMAPHLHWHLGHIQRQAERILAPAGLAALLPQVDEVHTRTSLLGFEALLHGKRVVTHGAPFYAGWGLTDDLSIPRRTRSRTLDELVAATLLLQPRYVDPRTGLPCDAWHVLVRLPKTGAARPQPLLQQRLRKYLGAMLPRFGRG